MTNTTTLPTYDDIVDYAEAIAANGHHDAHLAHYGRHVWTVGPATDGTVVVWDTKTGGRCYPLAELLHDDHVRNAVRRTAAMRRRP